MLSPTYAVPTAFASVLADLRIRTVSFTYFVPVLFIVDPVEVLLSLVVSVFCAVVSDAEALSDDAALKYCVFT